jgi:Zn finger protein HypA/HybF involved in hydrogenase expression
MQKGCKRKHIETKIPLHHWICPNCFSMEFYYHHDKDYKVACFALHEDDVCWCRNCGYNIPAHLFVKMWKNKNKGKVLCPRCDGTGLIDEENKMVKATEEEISKTIDKAIKIVEEEKGELSYEEGVMDALAWVLGEADNPLDEE